MALGLAAASAVMVKPAAAQTTDYKDATPWPGVVVRAYSGETPSLIPGFKTVSMRDVIMQPGSKTMGPPMENAMVCHIAEGELQVEQDGKTFTAKKEFRLDLQQGHKRAVVQCEQCGCHYADHRPNGLRPDSRLMSGVAHVFKANRARRCPK
jgi:hypothetical protein